MWCSGGVATEQFCRSVFSTRLTGAERIGRFFRPISNQEIIQTVFARM